MSKGVYVSYEDFCKFTNILKEAGDLLRHLYFDNKEPQGNIESEDKKWVSREMVCETIKKSGFKARYIARHMGIQESRLCEAKKKGMKKDSYNYMVQAINELREKGVEDNTELENKKREAAERRRAIQKLMADKKVDYQEISKHLGISPNAFSAHMTWCVPEFFEKCRKAIFDIAKQREKPEVWDENKHNNLENFEYLIKTAGDSEKNVELLNKMKEWFSYKDHRKPRGKNHYQMESIRSLTNRLWKAAKDYGTSAALDLVDYSIANNYQGIIFDRLPKK